MAVVVHCRDAAPVLDEVLGEWASGQGGRNTPPTRGMLHCFSEDVPFARRMMALGFCISLAGPVTFRNARQLPEVARDVPLDALLVETDSPYLTPHPYRGQRNEPGRVAATAKRIAELRGIDFDELAQATSANAARLFGLTLPG